MSAFTSSSSSKRVKYVCRVETDDDDYDYDDDNDSRFTIAIKGTPTNPIATSTALGGWENRPVCSRIGMRRPVARREPD